MSFQLLKSKEVLKARVFTLCNQTWRGPNGPFTRQVILHPGAVAMVPFDAKGRILMIKQFRPSVNSDLLEIPAGTLEKGERPLPCAKRELMEEIGFAASKWKQLGEVYTAPGFCSERIVLFKAWDLTPQKAKGDEDEFIEVVPMTPREVRRAVRSGKIHDAKSLSAFLHLEWL